MVYSVVVTNEGLITAKNVNVSKPLVENALTGKFRNTADLKVEYLTDHVFDLRPKESAVVTYKVTRAAFTELDGCTAVITGTFQYDLGSDTKQGQLSGGLLISQKCKKEDLLGGLGNDSGEEFEMEEGEEGDDNDGEFKLEWPDEDKTYDETKSDNKPEEEIEDDEGIVIAKIKLQFNQRMTMTRQAFRGTLVVENGTDGQMKDIVLTLRETDPQGNVATSHEFQVNNETIEGFGGTLEGPWTLDAKKTGKATILYIPTKYAAPYEPVEYTFGGQLSFKDPANGSVATEEVTDIKVEFNKPITESTFTTDDIELMIQGNKVACDKVVISKVDELTYNVNIANVERADGLYILTVQTATIDDAEGYYGGEGSQCSWNEFTGKPVALKFALKRNGFGKLAENACSVTMSDGATVGSSYPFGTKLKLKAVPAYGYTFERWAINGTTLSTSDELEYRLTSSKEVELWQKPDNYDIAVSSSNGGSINGGSGRYEYLEEIELVATPADGYDFVGWYAKSAQTSSSKKLRAPDSATLLGKEMTLRYTVVGEATIYPEFAKQQTVIDCTIASIRCGTLILPFDSDIPEGMSVYSCSGIGDENIVELVEETNIKANTPYIIAGTPGTYHFYGNRIIEEYVWTSDYLTGTFETMYVPKDAYVLQNQKEYGVGFYRVKDDNSVRITPYHCYFNALNGSGAKFFKMSFGSMTSISNVTDNTAKPVRVYNINGQMVRTAESIGKALRELPAGIYIINNRKYSINNK